MDWQPVFSGNIWQVMQGLHASGKTFEKAVRAPGSRLILAQDGKILLSRELRRELNNRSDYRLPGGKVFDTNEDYQAFLASGDDIVEASRASIVKEALEEVGLIIAPQDLTHLGVDVLGATCEWDLHYLVAEQFELHADGAQHHESEADEIEGSVWVSEAEARALALDTNRFAESRSARMLLAYLNR